jgi:hypothetical protein
MLSFGSERKWIVESKGEEKWLKSIFTSDLTNAIMCYRGCFKKHSRQSLPESSILLGHQGRIARTSAIKASCYIGNAFFSHCSEPDGSILESRCMIAPGLYVCTNLISMVAVGAIEKILVGGGLHAGVIHLSGPATRQPESDVPTLFS